MEITALHGIAALVVLILGLGAGYVVGTSRRASELAAAQARAERLEEENLHYRDRSEKDTSLLRAMAPIQSQLETMTERVGHLERSHTEQSSRLSEQLALSARSTATLHEVTTSLRGALTSTSARGTWGEVELTRIVEAAGMVDRVHYTTQQTQASGQRPDMVVHLPGGGAIPVDAKVPLSAYLEASELSEQDPRRQSLLADHAKAVRSHMTALAKRDYPAQFPDSPRITVMFMPTEALLAQALMADPALLEDAARRGVALTSPASLLALLRAVAATWSSSKVTEEARGVLELGRELVDRLSTLATHLDSLGRSLTSSVTSYNKAVASMESRLIATARKFDSLPEVAGPAGLDGDKTSVRAITAAELL